jgi:hypothetical protein
MMVQKPGKLQSHKNRRPLFDVEAVELYLTVHKSFVSTSLNTIHRCCTFHNKLSLLDGYFIAGMDLLGGWGGGVHPLALARGGVGGAIFHDKAKNY